MKDYWLIDDERDLYKEQIHWKVKAFKDKYSYEASRKPHLWKEVSKAALYNYAMSLLNVEYYKLGKDDRKEVLSRYE